MWPRDILGVTMGTFREEVGVWKTVYKLSRSTTILCLYFVNPRCLYLAGLYFGKIRREMFTMHFSQNSLPHGFPD